MTSNIKVRKFHNNSNVSNRGYNYNRNLRPWLFDCVMNVWLTEIV